MKPKTKEVRLPLSKPVAQAPARDARDTTVPLLTDPRVKGGDCLLLGDDPLAGPPEEVTHPEDLNTGDARLEALEVMTKEKGEVLLPAALCMDGAATGQPSDLPLAPVKIALGMHKRETRDRDCAWRELGWVPQARKQEARGKKTLKESGRLEARSMKPGDGEGENTEDVGPEAKGERKARDEDEENEVPAQDSHTMLRVMLESFVELQRTGLAWDPVHKGKLHKSTMLKVFVPLAKCDAEEADMLCGRFKVRTRTVKQVRRRRHCPTVDSDDPRVNHKKKKQHKTQKMVDSQDEDGLTATSQQCVQDARHKAKLRQANDHQFRRLDVRSWLLEPQELGVEGGTSLSRGLVALEAHTLDLQPQAHQSEAFCALGFADSHQNHCKSPTVGLRAIEPLTLLFSSAQQSFISGPRSVFFVSSSMWIEKLVGFIKPPLSGLVVGIRGLGGVSFCLSSF